MHCLFVGCFDVHVFIVSHSAGVGRTGTFIALDSLHQHGLKIQFVEILGYIKRMRECRMSMIQNVVCIQIWTQQY